MAKAPSLQFTTRRGNGSATLAGVDGRTTMARRYREITTAIESDLGGDPTEAARAVVSRAATLACWCEQQEAALANGQDFDISGYTMATNALRRLLSDIGLERRQKDVTPSLSEYLSQKAAASE